MKHFRRILFNTLTAISLLLAIATAGLWVRSVSSELYLVVGWPLYDVGATVNVAFGGIDVLFDHPEPEQRNSTKITSPQAWSGFFGSDDFSDAEYALSERIFGDSSNFRFEPNVSPGESHFRLPIWLPLLAGLLLPFARMLRFVRSRHDRPGRCPACGYDIRANPARCSECGYGAITNARNPNEE